MIGALLKRVLPFAQKYALVGLAASSAAAIVFAYLYKEALQDVARVRAEAQVEALAAANAKAALVAQRLQEAHATREAQLKERAQRSADAAKVARDEAAKARQSLSDFETQQQDDTSPEYTEWRDTKLPSGVVERLKRLPTRPEI